MKIKFTEKEKQEIKEIGQRFSKTKLKDNITIFYDLCFCIMAPQTTYNNNIQTIDFLIENKFYNTDIPVEVLEESLKKVRFYKNKTRYLLHAKENFDQLINVVCAAKEPKEIRNDVVKLIKGMGMKTASHFMRNLGFDDLAIIDVHILRFLGLEKNLISKKEYLELEEKFAEIAVENDLTIMQLDAWVWAKGANVSLAEFSF